MTGYVYAYDPNAACPWQRVGREHNGVRDTVMFPLAPRQVAHQNHGEVTCIGTHNGFYGPELCIVRPDGDLEYVEMPK